MEIIEFGCGNQRNTGTCLTTDYKEQWVHTDKETVVASVNTQSNIHVIGASRNIGSGHREREKWTALKSKKESLID